MFRREQVVLSDFRGLKYGGGEGFFLCPFVQIMCLVLRGSRDFIPFVFFFPTMAVSRLSEIRHKVMVIHRQFCNAHDLN